MHPSNSYNSSFTSGCSSSRRVCSPWICISRGRLSVKNYIGFARWNVARLWCAWSFLMSLFFLLPTLLLTFAISFFCKLFAYACCLFFFCLWKAFWYLSPFFLALILVTWAPIKLLDCSVSFLSPWKKMKKIFDLPLQKHKSEEWIDQKRCDG